MLAPLSWLKQYVNITFKPNELGDRLTEIGLGTEKINKIDDDVVFEFEITPNRPDLLSIIGIAREIAAIENKQVKIPEIKTDVTRIKPKKILPLEIKTDPKINPRFTAIIIDGIKVKESPDWLKERLVKIGQRPINNIVDITNYVMFESGNPIHAFDYNKISGHLLKVVQAKGGESFTSVDGLSYKLPKGAVVIEDREKVIDLCGIKGGENSGTYETTKTIIIRVPVEDPVLSRKTSQALGLRSEASSIFERGVNKGGTIDALKRCADLVLELAGGEVASKLFDIKTEDFKPWKLKLRIDRLNKILGIAIPEKKVISILESLNLSPILKANTIETTIPTYRNDLQIEEDLMEEVARIYGYNNFPKTLPSGELPTETIPYARNNRFFEKAKDILTASGFSEIYTYSLISEKDLEGAGINPNNCLRVDNPVSREFEYLRPTLKINLIKALAQNSANFEEINLFELGKVYTGKTIDQKSEPYYLSGISNSKNYRQIKGLLEKILHTLGIETEISDTIEVINEGIIFELNFSGLLEKESQPKIFIPIPKYPPIIEDIAIVAPEKTKAGDIIKLIKKQNPVVASVDLIDIYENKKTFRIKYQHSQRNLTNEEIALIREKIHQSLQKELSVNIV